MTTLSPNQYKIMLTSAGHGSHECTGFRGITCIRDLQILAADLWGDGVIFWIKAPTVGWNATTTSRGVDR